MIVYREDVIREVDAEMDNIDHVPQWFIDRIDGAIKRVPSLVTTKGKWIKTIDETSPDKPIVYRCSKCGNTHKDIYKRGESNGKWSDFVLTELFCNKCGADMREERDKSEVKVGRWEVSKFDGQVTCSRCNGVVSKAYAICPHCKSKMNTTLYYEGVDF